MWLGAVSLIPARGRCWSDRRQLGGKDWTSSRVLSAWLSSQKWKPHCSPRNGRDCELKTDNPIFTRAEIRVCQGIPLRGRNKKHKKIPLKIAEWNIRTLLDRQSESIPKRRTALTAHELNRYKVDTAALSETRLSGADSLTEVGQGYTFFWKGYEENQPRNHGVGLAIRTKLLSKFNNWNFTKINDIAYSLSKASISNPD